MNFTYSGMDRVKGKAAGLEKMALTMALPHENRAQRLPALPVTWTAVTELMSDTAVQIPNATSRRAVLCRDPALPLWMDKSYVNVQTGINAFGLWTLPAAAANSALGVPDWTEVKGTSNTGTIDGTSVTNGQVSDELVLGQMGGELAVFVPPTAYFSLVVVTGNSQAGVTLVIDLKYFYLGEWKLCTLGLAGNANGFQFNGNPGTQTANAGQVFEGYVPIGFVRMVAMRVGTVAITNSSGVPELVMGWSSGPAYMPGVSNPTGTVVALGPVFPPAEWTSSQVPYLRSRATATAALFTNVTAVLSKEGTVLAGRLKSSIVDFFNFGVANVNMVHPRMRYFGPLEKGLYTFTTPGIQDNDFVDCQYPITSQTSSIYATARPLFQFGKVGLYNAMIFNDLGNGSAGSNMATSLYVHLEFESTSSLFTPGVSTYTLEQLHAAEVALLSFGHFHENPLHWAAIKQAAMTALRYVGPMVAPIVQQVGTNLLAKGVKLLTGSKAAGDRRMSQAMSARPAQQPKPKKAKPKARKRLPRSR